MIQRVLIAIAASVSIIASTVARAECMYTVTVVELACPGPGNTGSVTGLNEQGHMVGGLYCGIAEAAAWAWYGEGEMVILPELPNTTRSFAYGIDDSGRIVGEASILGLPGPAVGFILENGVITIPEADGLYFEEAQAISNTGLVTGFSQGPFKAIVWDGDRILDISPLLPGSKSRAYDVSAGGWVVGQSDESLPNDERAFVYNIRSGEATSFGPIPGGTSSTARAVNAYGRFVGEGDVRDETKGTGGNVLHALYFDGTDMRDLGTLPGRTSSRAWGINDEDLVVGSSYNEQTPTMAGGFIWRNGRMTNLNDVLDTEASIVVTSAQAINDQGQIAASAAYQSSLVPVLLTPYFRGGDIDQDCIVGFQDLLIVISNWGLTMDSLADVNDDGVVDTLDLEIVLNSWG